MTVGNAGSSPREDNSPTPREGKEVSNKKGNWQQRQGGKQVAVPRQTKFEGKSDDLKGYIYDCSDSRQADQFAKTTKEIAEFVGRTYKYGGDARLAIENLEIPVFPEPDDPPAGASKTKERIWEKLVDEHVKRQIYMTENVKTIYSLVWGQCSDIMRQKLEALDGFDSISTGGNGIQLLKSIKSLTYNFQSQKYLPHSLHETTRRFYLFSQGKLPTVIYHEQFVNMVEVIDTIKGSIGMAPGLEEIVAKENNKAVADLTDAEKMEAKERYLAVAFLLGSDRARFGKLIENLENDFLQGRDNYPKSVTGAFNILINWKQDPRNLVRSVGVTNDGVAFANVDCTESDDDTDGEVVMNNNGKPVGRGRRTKDKSKVICRRCGQKGHYASECDNERLVRDAPSGGSTNDTASTTSSLTSGSSGAPRQTGATMLLAGMANCEFDDNDLTTGFQFLTNAGATVLKCSTSSAVPKTWILLDNQSTVDVFHNSSLLKNIREADSYMDIHCNAGVTSTNLIGDLPGYGTVWYHPNGIANILSLARVRERGYKVTFDSQHGNSFHVTKPDGTVRVFNQSDRGLYFMETTANGNQTTLVNTVADNQTRYNKRDYSQAVLARKIQGLIGRPSTRQYMSIVDSNLLPNCPVNRKDINAAEDIFGPDIGNLKGKTVRRPTPHIRTKLLDIPMKIMKLYREVTIACDIDASEPNPVCCLHLTPSSFWHCRDGD